MFGLSWQKIDNVDEYNKLSEKEVGPYTASRKTNDNAYLLKLSSNVKHLILYVGDSSSDEAHNLSVSFSQLEEDDVVGLALAYLKKSDRAQCNQNQHNWWWLWRIL